VARGDGVADGCVDNGTAIVGTGVGEAVAVGVGEDVDVGVGVSPTRGDANSDLDVTDRGSVVGGKVGVGMGVSDGSGVAVGAGAEDGSDGAVAASQIVSKARAGGGAEPSPHTQPSISPLPTVHVAAPMPE